MPDYHTKILLMLTLHTYSPRQNSRHTHLLHSACPMVELVLCSSLWIQTMNTCWKEPFDLLKINQLKQSHKSTYHICHLKSMLSTMIEKKSILLKFWFILLYKGNVIPSVCFDGQDGVAFSKATAQERNQHSRTAYYQEWLHSTRVPL